MVKTDTNQARIFRMISPEGFTNLFWETIREAQQQDKPLTHEKAFEKLNQEYFLCTGKYRYKSFQSFKTLRDK